MQPLPDGYEMIINVLKNLDPKLNKSETNKKNTKIRKIWTYLQ